MGIATAGTPGFFLSLDVFEAGPQQGKIVAGGTQTYAYGDPAFGELITRFTPDGHPDQGFGDGGVVVLPWKNSRPNGVTGTAAEADGSTRS